jgi:hypothetical protein
VGEQCVFWGGVALRRPCRVAVEGLRDRYRSCRRVKRWSSKILAAVALLQTLGGATCLRLCSSGVVVAVVAAVAGAGLRDCS